MGIQGAALQGQIGFAVLGKVLDTAEVQLEGAIKMIEEIAAPPQAGYGDVLNVRA